MKNKVPSKSSSMALKTYLISASTLFTFFSLNSLKRLKKIRKENWRTKKQANSSKMRMTAFLLF
jgi:hypothetical protein